MNSPHGKGRSFAKRIYAPRTVGVSLGFITVAVSLHELDGAMWLWAVAIFNAFFWPHLAYQLARRSRHSYQAEWRNLLVDSLAGGFWIGAMGFSAMPSITVVAMMAMHNIAAGGPRLMFQGFGAQALGAAIAALLVMPVIDFHNSAAQTYACLPVLVIYPIFIGWMSHQVTLKLWEHRNILSTLSRTDSLTGLTNHGAWKDQLAMTFIISQNMRRPSTIALIDIDHFKTINDTYGHMVGDGVLREVSTILVANLRSSDLAGRYGGDEFCVILPDTGHVQAGQILERLRIAVAGLEHPDHPGLKLSLSIGLAARTADLTDADMWLHEADKALYIAKHNGRNRVVMAQDQTSQLTTA
ncbi:diguanylate cyclase [Pseudomonas sp. v388]|uniref:diguanylate cyclase n=1 Tax=Pseudomonas sp. v388 TaxID=2479849 RepID=UPI000F766470|nr:diguanylate cyclase [Pseudomonas sp. v388]RRV06896.1 diguanylate cyclase [Pseudomonas sp. v388]